MVQPWTVLRRRWIFEDRWYRLLVETVDPGDRRPPEDYYLGVFNDIALIVAITEARQVVFVRQYKHGAQRVLIELPAGYCETGEEPLAAARRELREETGYAGGHWSPLGAFYSNPTKERGGRLHLFLALGVKLAGPPMLDATEVIDLLAVDLPAAYAPGFLADLAVAGTRLALELARPELHQAGLLP